MPRLVIPSVLVAVAIIHALPVAGVLGAPALARLYGVPVGDASLELLLRHRAALFGIVAVFLAYAAFRPELHRLALVAACASVVSFLLLAGTAGPLTRELRTVVVVDWVALALLAVGAIAAWAPRR